MKRLRMPESKLARAVILLICAGLLLGMAVVSGATVQQQYPDLPSESAVVDTPERYVGEKVLLEGRVVEVDPVVIAVPDGSSHRRFTLVGTAQAVQQGADVEVYGTLEELSTIRVIEMVAVTERGLWYVYSISGLAILWVLARFGRHWRLDRREFGLRSQRTTTEESTTTATHKERQDA